MSYYLNRAAQTAELISKRFSEKVVEAYEGSAKYLDQADDKDIANLLESRYDRDKLEGLKRLIAVSYLDGFDKICIH
jgi:phosphohistidine phosphatase SixA